jgi:hypothetical protein
MKINQKFPMIVASVLAMMIISPNIVHADVQAHPYVAGYPVTSLYYKVNNIWMNTDFSGSTPSSLPCYIANVVSVAGGTGTAQTGWVYQSASVLYGSASPSCGISGDVFSDPEVWNGSTFKWSPSAVDFGSYSAISNIKHRADWQNAQSQVQFVYEVTKSGSTTLYGFTYNKSDYSDPSSYFMVGSTTANGFNIRMLQFGVESYASSTYPPGWQMTQHDMGFYDSVSGTNKNLSSMSATAVQGQNSYITWSGGTTYSVGSQQFKFTDKTSSTGTVTWKYNAANTNGVPDGTSLW